ncbi:hypothetical protein JW851_00720 [Candidatus Woesearchaeota archaeon]|nr:hypothetical protein [Candidatus Woesearchaeota archaeon]
MSNKKEVDSRNYSPRTIFTYSIEHLLKKDKIRFYYALKGRDGKSGIFKTYKIEQLGRAVLLVNPKFEKQVQEFLESWKCRFNKRRVLIGK